jgi:hypothetical protein
MATTVRVITGELPALVLSYPRDADPVFGAEFTEVAQLPAHFEQSFTLSAGFDLLVTEAPFDAAAAADGADLLEQQADAFGGPTASLHEAA